MDKSTKGDRMKQKQENFVVRVVADGFEFMLRLLAEENGRSLGGQVYYLVRQDYEKKFGKAKKGEVK